MQCTIDDCPGTYEARTTVGVDQVCGALAVIDQVPVEVCDVCGDTLFAPETLRHLEALRRAPVAPTRTVPLYEYT